MELTNRNTSNKLPIVTLNNDVIGTSELQKVSGAYLKRLKDEGPKIVSIGGVKRAVIVEYDQYMHFQDTFGEIFKKMSMINQLLPKVPDEHKLQIDKLRLEISGTLQRIVEESPDSSPFADLMDAILGVAAGLFENQSQPAPMELKNSVNKALSSSAKKVTKTDDRPKRNLTE